MRKLQILKALNTLSADLPPEMVELIKAMVSQGKDLKPDELSAEARDMLYGAVPEIKP